jgi:hypothetical protein
MRKRECGMPKATSKCENNRNSPGHLSMKLSGFVLPISIFMMNGAPIHKPPNLSRLCRTNLSIHRSPDEHPNEDRSRRLGRLQARGGLRLQPLQNFIMYCFKYFIIPYLNFIRRILFFIYTMNMFYH